MSRQSAARRPIRGIGPFGSTLLALFIYMPSEHGLAQQAPDILWKTNSPGRVDDLAFARNGAYVAAIASLDAVKVWSLPDKREFRSFPFDDPRSIAISPNSRLIAVAGRRGHIDMWRIEDGRLRWTADADRTVDDIAFSPEGDLLASASSDDPIHLWRASDGSLLRTLSGPTARNRSPAFSPDGSLVASGGDDRRVSLWSVESGQFLRSWPMDFCLCDVDAIVFSPDGKLLATGAMFATMVWDVESGSEVRRLSVGLDDVLSLAFSPDGEVLYIGGDSDFRTDAELFGVSMVNGALVLEIREHRNLVEEMALSSDGSTLVSGSREGSIRFWSVETETIVDMIGAHYGAVTGIWASRHSDLVVSAGAAIEIQLRNAADGRPSGFYLGGFDGGFTDVVMSPSEEHIVLTTADSYERNGGIAVIEKQTGERIRDLRPYSAIGVWTVDVSPEGDLIAAGDSTHRVQLWEFDTGTLIQAWMGHDDDVRAVAFSPEASRWFRPPMTRRRRSGAWPIRP